MGRDGVGGGLGNSKNIFSQGAEMLQRNSGGVSACRGRESWTDSWDMRNGRRPDEGYLYRRAQEDEG